MQAVNDYLAKSNKPGNFRPDDPRSATVAVETSYQTLCASLENNGSNTIGMTVMQLYSRLNYYRQQQEKIKKTT